MLGAALAVLAGTTLPGWSPRGTRPGADSPARLFAAVFLVRGNVAGSAAPGYGLYTKSVGDTAWSPLPVCRTMAFGLGLYERGATRRYYVAGGNGVHRSTDGGRTWKILTSWRTEEILSVAPDPEDAEALTVATPEGAFRSTDGGSTWQERMNGIPTRFVQRLILDRRNSRWMYAATETDLFRSTDAGGRWRAMGSGLRDLLAIIQSDDDPRLFIAAGESRGIRRTTDDGRTWRDAKGLEGATVYALRSAGPGGALYAAGWQTGLWRSDDRGATWRVVWDAPGIEAVYSIFVFPGNPDHILLGTVGSGVLESADGGKTWRDGGLEGAQVKQIELYP